MQTKEARTKARRKPITGQNKNGAQFAPEKHAQIEALRTGAHLLLTQVTSSDGPFASVFRFEEAGRPTEEARSDVEEANLWVGTAAALVKLAHEMTFGPPTDEQRKAARS